MSRLGERFKRAMLLGGQPFSIHQLEIILSRLHRGDRFDFQQGADCIIQRQGTTLRERAQSVRIDRYSPDYGNQIRLMT